MVGIFWENLHKNCAWRPSVNCIYLESLSHWIISESFKEMTIFYKWFLVFLNTIIMVKDNSLGTLGSPLP